MKNISKQILPLIIVAAILLLFTQCTDKVQKAIENNAKELNGQCPLEVDEITRLDSCSPLPHTLKYNYTLKLNTVETMDTNIYKERLTPALLYKIQTNNLLNDLKKNKVSFIYSYKDKNGRQVANITILPDDYNKAPVAPKNTLEGNDLTSSLQQIVDEQKRMLPADFPDQAISMTDCRLLPPATLSYTYKLTDKVAEGFDSVQFKQTSRETIIPNLKQSAQNLVEKEVTIQYVYTDKNDKYLCTLTFRPEELKN